MVRFEHDTDTTWVIYIYAYIYIYQSSGRVLFRGERAVLGVGSQHAVKKGTDDITHTSPPNDFQARYECFVPFLGGGSVLQGPKGL